MKIEIWSDYVCPFCYIGKHKLEEALKQFPHRDQVDIEFKGYQLEPDMPPYSGQDFFENMAKKFGSVEQSKQMMAGVAQQAKAEGLDFHFDTMKPANTFDAHRLIKFAREHGKDADVSEKVFYANFTESKDIGNIEVLAEIAAEAGLNKDDARANLEDKEAYAADVKADIAEARELNITGVPYFIFNRKYALSGAQQTEAFTQALEKVWEEEKPNTTFESLDANDSDGTCGGDGCDVPNQK